MALGTKILKSAVFQSLVVWLLAQYIRFCWATTRWQQDGLDALKAQLGAHGPVIMVLWHESLIYAPKAWPTQDFPVCSLTQDANAGRLAGLVMERFGFENRCLDARVSGVGIMREVMQLARDGVSIGIAADGPEGPARIAKEVPVDWSRVTGLPIWFYAFETSRHKRLKTWDRMMLPLPFARGRISFRPWDRTVPRKLDPRDREELRSALEIRLNAVADGTA